MIQIKANQGGGEESACDFFAVSPRKTARFASEGNRSRRMERGSVGEECNPGDGDGLGWVVLEGSKRGSWNWGRD